MSDVEIMTSSLTFFTSLVRSVTHGIILGLWVSQELPTPGDKVTSIRDTESVVAFQQRLKGCERMVIVGNGGIATELV